MSSKHISHELFYTKTQPLLHVFPKACAWISNEQGQILNTPVTASLITLFSSFHSKPPVLPPLQSSALTLPISLLYLQSLVLKLKFRQNDPNSTNIPS